MAYRMKILLTLLVSLLLTGMVAHQSWGFLQSYIHYHRLDNSLKALCLEAPDSRMIESGTRGRVGLSRSIRRLSPLLSECGFDCRLFDVKRSAIQQLQRTFCQALIVDQEGLEALESRKHSPKVLLRSGSLAWVTWTDPALIPMEVGEVLRHEYARPQIYDPVGESLMIRGQGDFERFEFRLDPGDYELHIDGKSKSKSALIVRIWSDDRSSSDLDVRQTFGFTPVSVAPFVVRFRVPSRCEEVHVQFRVSVRGEREEGLLRIHGFEIQRHS